MTNATKTGIAAIGHIGIYVRDLAKSTEFWSGLFDMEISDGSVEAGFCFLTADYEVEHHMLLLRSGRTAAPGVEIINQIAFICHSLEDVQRFSAKLRAVGVPTQDVNHGNAISCYFRDPDGNRGEVYVQTGLEATQPFSLPIDLRRSTGELWQQVREEVSQYGETGVRTPVDYLLVHPAE